VVIVLVLAHTLQLKECVSFFPFLPLGVFFITSYMFPQTGLFTGVSLAIILGVSFGSLATLFTNDSEVLGIVRSGLLVCISVSLGSCPIFVICFIILFISSCLNLLQFVSASQPINALAYIFDGLHYGISDFSYAAISMVSCLVILINYFDKIVAMILTHSISLYHFF